MYIIHIYCVVIIVILYCYDTGSSQRITDGQRETHEDKNRSDGQTWVNGWLCVRVSEI